MMPPLATLLELLRSRSGLSERSISAERVEAHLAARAAALGLGGDLARGARRIADDPAEFALLEAALSPPETWLFRYPESFGFLRARADALLRSGRREPCTVLVLGCGGWCEPVSIAVALDAAAVAGIEVRILATDRNPALLAAPPRFTGMQLRGGLPSYASPCFEPDGDGLRPIARVTRRIVGATADAATALEAAIARGERFDAVFFRNVAIYLDDLVRGRIFALSSRVLSPEGALFVGHAEEHAAALASGLVPSGASGAFALVARATSPGPVGRDERKSARQTRTSDVPKPEAARVSQASLPRAASADRVADPLAEARREVLRRPGDAAAHVGLARALEDAGDLEAALAATRRALYLARGDEGALVLAARLAETLGRADEAARLRARAIDAHLGSVEERERGLRRDGGGEERPDRL